MKRKPTSQHQNERNTRTEKNVASHFGWHFSGAEIEHCARGNGKMAFEMVNGLFGKRAQCDSRANEI